MNYVENQKIIYKELLFISGHPQTVWNGIYGQHTAPSFRNIILLIMEIRYFTSFYQARFVLMYIIVSWRGLLTV